MLCKNFSGEKLQVHNEQNCILHLLVKLVLTLLLIVPYISLSKSNSLEMTKPYHFAWELGFRGGFLNSYNCVLLERSGKKQFFSSLRGTKRSIFFNYVSVTSRNRNKLKANSRLYVQSIPSSFSDEVNSNQRKVKYTFVNPETAFDRVIPRGDDTIKYGRYGKDILPLWVADMDFAAADCIKDSLQRRLDHGIFGYTQPNPAVEETVTSYLEKKHDYSIEKEQIFFLHGLNPAMTVLAKSLQYSRSNANTVMVNTPIYPPFLWTPKTSTLKVKQIPLQYDYMSDDDIKTNESSGIKGDKKKRWKMDLVQIEDQMRMCNEDCESSGEKDIIGMFLLCNPHNPVGTCFHEEELVQLGRLCGKYNILLVSDEVHCDLILPSVTTSVSTAWAPHMDDKKDNINDKPKIPERKHLAMGSLLQSEKYKDDEDFQKLSLVSLHAPSKTFNVPGLMCAYMVVDSGNLVQRKKDEMVYIKQAAKGFVTEVNPFGYTALDAAYKYGEPWRKACVDYLVRNREFVQNFIDEKIPEISYYESHEATYLIWLNVEKLDLILKEKYKKEKSLQENEQTRPMTSQEFFMNEAKVAVNEGIDFGCRGHVRLNFACPRATLEEGLERMATAIDKLKEGLYKVKN